MISIPRQPISRTLLDIGWQRRMGLYGRIQGYRRAAEILHHAMLADQSVRDSDTVVFPYAACWRHHIKLQLKSVLVQLWAMCDLPAKSAHHHKIDQLWAETQKIIAREFPEETFHPRQQCHFLPAQPGHTSITTENGQPRPLRRDTGTTGTEELPHLLGLLVPLAAAHITTVGRAAACREVLPLPGRAGTPPRPGAAR